MPATAVIKYRPGVSGLGAITCQLWPKGSESLAPALSASLVELGTSGCYSASGAYGLVGLYYALLSGPVADWGGVQMTDEAADHEIAPGNFYAADKTGVDVKSSVSSLVGPGGISFPVTLFKANGITPLIGARVWVSTDPAGTSVIAGTLTTNDQGAVTFMLDAGTYYMWVDSADSNFVNPLTVTVS